MRLSHAPFLVLALIPTTVGAQHASLMTGGGVAQLDQLSSEPISTLGVMANASLGPLLIDIAGNTTNYRDLGNANRAHSALWLTANRRGWRVQAGPVLSMGSTVRESWTTAWSADVLVARTFGRAELEVRSAEGITRPDGQHISFGRRGATARADFGSLQIGAAYDVTIVRDSTLRDDVFFDPRAAGDDELFRDRVRHVHDASISVDYGFSSALLRGTIGRRRGDDIATQTFWRVDVDLPVATIASIVFSASRDPADVALGLRGGRTTTLGFRLALPDGSEGTVVTFATPVEVERDTDGMVRVLFTLPGGSRARIMGEMTGWRPIELESLGHGRYQAWFRATPGTYRVNVALDEGPWIAPPGMARVDDGFGGMVGLLEL